MKVSSPNKKAITQTAVMGVGAGLGIGAGRIANGYFPKEKQTSGIAKIAVAAALVYGAAAIGSNDMVSNAGKGLLAGAAGEKLVSGVADLLDGSSIAVVSDTDPEATKLAQTALGLRGADCGCTSTPYVQMPALNFTPRREQPIDMVETAPNSYSVADMLR